jgi:hypothetical protein
MENQAVGPYKNAMRFGTYLGLASIIVSVLFYLLGMETSQVPQYLQYVIIITLIVLGTKHHRDVELGGFISYRRALWTGVLITFFSSIILAFYTYLFITFIDTGFMDKMLDMQEQAMLQRGLTDEEIEMAMKMNAKIFTPVPFTFIMVLSLTFLGFIFSLITSAFLKKENKSFGSFQ